MSYKATLAKSRHLSPRHWAERTSWVGQMGIRGPRWNADGEAQRQGNADRRLVGMTGLLEALNSTALCGLCKNPSSPCPRVGSLFGGGRPPAHEAVAVCRV